MERVTASGARAGVLTTPHGALETPFFMPVATQATVKGVDVGRLRDTGARMVLANAYHLHLRPGEDQVAVRGGLQAFMGWDGPMLTDSGGFQVFSLAKQVRVTEEAAHFQSHLDGSAIELSPERSMQIQERLGADIAMQLDHVVALPSSREKVDDAMQRSLRWAVRCRDAHQRQDQALFGIVQGGLEEDLRFKSAEKLIDIGFDGYAIGGLSVGEGPHAMYATLRSVMPVLPLQKPRYLMGVGRPQDILEAVSQGVDMFDCVLPTRCGRNALAYTLNGTIRLRNARHSLEEGPIEEGCLCAACRHSRSYLRHLFLANEMLGPILVSIHNLTFYSRLMGLLREAIIENRFDEVKQNLERSLSGGEPLSSAENDA